MASVDQDWSASMVLVGRLFSQAGHRVLRAYTSDDAFHAGLYLAALLLVSLWVIALSLLVVPTQAHEAVFEPPACMLFDPMCP
jgi:hypothetical protein